MKKKYIIINSFLILIGIILSLVSVVQSFLGETSLLFKFGAFFSDLGIAMITGGITAMITSFVISDSDNSEESIQEKWGLYQIYKKRSDMNVNCDKELENCRKQVDFIVYGMKNFRDAASDVVIRKVNSGVKIRIITSEPESIFLQQKAIEEGEVPGSTAQSIKDLIEWAKDINAKTKKKAIEIKLYNSLPMFSYQRIDDTVFVGPNLYGIVSQKCISFEFQGKKGAEYFKNYFEKLWNDDSLRKVV